MADFHQHIVLDKASGMFRHVVFTPDNPAAFRVALEAALAAYRATSGGAAGRA